MSLMRRNRGRRRRTIMAAPPPAAAAATTTPATTATARIIALVSAILLGLSSHLASEAAVVRPTVFSDLNAPDSQQQQQPQSSNGLQLADGPQLSAANTKINPYKSRFCSSASGQRLDAPVGLQSMLVDDLALSASSYSNEQVGPHLARLNLDLAGGAWCPVKPISLSNFGKEWIQVKLNRSLVVSALETQGRFAMGSGKEFVPSYQVEYSRNGGQTWIRWKDLKGASLLRANDDVNTPVRNELSPPIVGANVIRILPYSQHLRTVCLRFELHGCTYDEGAPIAYATSDGVVELPRWGHLNDYTYDGLKRNGLLTNGLGQLVDGVKGHHNFTHNSGFEWVGWKSMNGDVIIEFSFKTIRNFSSALFHSNNLFSSGVEVFQAVDVHYGIDVPLSIDSLRDQLVEQRRRDAAYRPRQPEPADQSPPPTGTLWSADVLSIEYEPDKRLETSRPVTVHLKQRLANKLRFVLKFASKWILVSEVEFLSQPVELLSLASASDQYTPALLAALAPAKSYDEYLAIVREHQLRRIATNAYLASFAPNPTTNATAGATQDSGPDQTLDQDLAQLTPAKPTTYDEYPARTDPLARRITGPPIPWPGLQDSSSAPSTNPVLNQLMPFGPPALNYGHPPSPELVPNAPTHPLSADQSPGAADKRPLGLATVISFVLVSILLFVGAFLAVSSYRVRHHAKLSSPLSARHLAALTNGKAGPLQSFINVFSSHHTGPAHPHSTLDSQYNAIFASSHATDEASLRTANTLRRLASLSANQSKANQVLVSVKDPSNSNGQLFAGGKPAGQVSSQLIVGLNQTNPLAQQQIYNNSSNLNCSNQTYATHYSTSMSMASSSTGRQGDYTDYAIPDAQPMIPPVQHHHHHHHNHAFNSSAAAPSHFKHPFGYQTEARASHRLQQQQQQQQHLSSLVQPLTPAQRPQMEHNYELIYNQDQQRSPLNPLPLAHQRTHSNQFASACHAPFSSMTLSQGRFLVEAAQKRLTTSGVEESSPGGSSNQSAATTATTSANSSAANSTELGLAPYYYTAHDAAEIRR